MSHRLMLIRHADLLLIAREQGYSVEGTAARCGVSVSTFQRYIHARFGKTARAWLQELRLQNAGLELAKGMKVRYASKAALYNSEATFSREFKKYFGYPPGEHSLRSRDAWKPQKPFGWNGK